MSTVLRQVASIAQKASRTRNFTSSAVTRKDIVQDLYIREIKSYKPIPAAKDAHVGIVKNLGLPPSPQTPSLPTDLASELADYDVTEPAIAAATATEGGVASSSSEGGAGGAEAFLTFLEQPLPKHEPAHH